MNKKNNQLPTIGPRLDRIESKILLIRGQKVMLDSDLAELYGVETKVLNRVVKRNINRFPEDFMLQLTVSEVESLRCQFGTSNLRSQFVISNRGGRRYLPYAFTEQGVAMLSSVLRSERAVLVNIEIMRAFVRLRRILASNRELARKLDTLERKYDRQFAVVFDAIRQLMAPNIPPHRRIGFTAREKFEKYSFNRRRQLNVKK
jgi:hypothetical protein